MFSFFRRFLGSSGASPSGPDAGTIRKFHDVVHMGDVPAVCAMLQQWPQLATSRDEYGFQPVHLMDMYFEEEILNLLLENGADLNAGNDEGVRLLHVIREPEAIALLVARGAELEIRDAQGLTPLIMQAGETQDGLDVVAELLACGANPNATGPDGESALSFAREAGDDELVRLLLASGAQGPATPA